MQLARRFQAMRLDARLQCFVDAKASLLEYSCRDGGCSSYRSDFFVQKSRNGSARSLMNHVSNMCSCSSCSEFHTRPASGPTFSGEFVHEIDAADHSRVVRDMAAPNRPPFIGRLAAVLDEPGERRHEVGVEVFTMAAQCMVYCSLNGRVSTGVLSGAPISFISRACSSLVTMAMGTSQRRARSRPVRKKDRALGVVAACSAIVWWLDGAVAAYPATAARVQIVWRPKGEPRVKLMLHALCSRNVKPLPDTFCCSALPQLRCRPGDEPRRAASPKGRTFLVLAIQDGEEPV